MPRASYKAAIDWIALNDEPGEDSPDETASLVSVCLVADLWGKDPRDVAAAVLQVRASGVPAASIRLRSYMRIGDAARTLGISPSGMRWLEIQGKLKPVTLTGGGQRLYDIAEVRALAAERASEQGPSATLVSDGE